jgi:hypothetical protein
MPYDFSAEYSQRNDDELLHLASARVSLTTEAAIALDAELRRRNLTESDRVEHQRFVKRQEQREFKRRRRKTFGTLKDRFTWLDLLWALLAMVLISLTYLALPSRYHLKPEWQEAAAYVMITSVVVVVASMRILWRKFAFWISLAISSAVQVVVVHAWTQRVPNPSHGASRGVLVLSFLLFLAVYQFVSVLRRNFYGKEANDNS